MLKQIATTALITLTTSLLPICAWSQPGTRALINLGRAENLARQAAENLNGGLEHYRAEDSMHGPAEQSPHVYDGHGTWTFTFKGHPPDSDVPTVESIVTVSRAGIVQVNYNGPIRPTIR